MDFEEEHEGVDIDYFLANISEEANARKMGAILIIIGSLLGVQLGIVLFVADPGAVLSGSIDSEDQYSDISGIVNSALTDNSSGGDPVEGVRVKLLNEDGTTTGKETLTDENGRFLIPDVVRQSSILFITHPGNESTRILLNPGDSAQIVVTLSPGDGEQIIDLLGESYLGESVLVAISIAFFTLFFGLSGVFGGIEAYKGSSYRRAWWFAFIGLWSRGMTFIGPLFILVGMGLVTLTKGQFSKGPS